MHKFYQDEITTMIEDLRVEAEYLHDKIHGDFSNDPIHDRLHSFLDVYSEIEKNINPEILKKTELRRHVKFVKLYINKNQKEYCEGDIECILEEDLDDLLMHYLEEQGNKKFDQILHDAVSSLIETAELDSAVRKSFVLLSERLRNKYNIPKGVDGTELVNRVFGKKGESKLDDSERENFRNLLSGMYGLFRNDYMHNSNDGEEALSIVHMINTLLLRIEKLEEN